MLLIEIVLRLVSLVNTCHIVVLLLLSAYFIPGTGVVNAQDVDLVMNGLFTSALAHFNRCSL
jgi:hypothetical protein